MADCTSASLEDFTRELVEGLANVHAEDAELHEIVSAAVPEGAHGFKSALQAMFEQVISPAEQDRAVGPADRPKVILSTNVAESSVTIEGVLTTALGALEVGRAGFFQDGTGGIALYLDATVVDSWPPGTTVEAVMSSWVCTFTAGEKSWRRLNRRQDASAL